MATTAVLGCGIIGSSWIETFSTHGHVVRAWDPVPGALAAVSRDYGALVQQCDSAESAVEGADFVQESGLENLESKRGLLQRIAAHLSATAIVASSTSTLQPSQLQAGIPFAERVLVGHPFNPPHILPLVEVVGGSATAEWAVADAMAFYAALGKHPIRLRLERPGHLANRLQAALWREAVDAVASGQASVEDVDAAVTLALGPRWALMGPFMTFHLGGGQGGLANFFHHLGEPFESLWDDARRPLVTAELKSHLARAVEERVRGRSLSDLTSERNTRLRDVLSVAARPLPGLAND